MKKDSPPLEAEMRELGYLLKDVSRLSVRNFERHAAEAGLGLNLAQCKVLSYLHRNQGLSQAQLAYLTDTDPMTLLRMVDRMEQDGWLERRADPEDRRVRRLHLKPAAAPLVKRIWSIADRARVDSLAGFDTQDRERLLGLLRRMHDNLSALVPSGGDAEPAVASPRAAKPSQPGRRRRRPQP